MSSSPPVALDLLVAVVAHRALLADRLSSYLSLLIENGFSILYQTHLLLTPEHLPLLLGQGVEDDVAVFTPTSPACVLLLQRVDAYPAFNSLRDQLDFVYGSSNRWTALRDQDTFFPSQPTLERCLLVLKPGYTQEDYAAVMEELDAQAFVTIDLTGKILSAEEAAALLDDPASVAGWSGGISVFVAVEQLHAQTRLSLLLGPDPPSLARTLAPTTLRARISSPVYLSPCPAQAAIDLRLAWPHPFPLQRTVALLGGPALSTLPALTAQLTAQGFTILHRTTTFLPRAALTRLFPQPPTPSLDAALTQWASGETVALLLTKAGAVRHWQVLKDGWGSAGFVYASSAERVEEDVRELFPLIPPAPRAMSAEEVMDRFTAPLPTPTPTPTPHSLQSVLTSALIALCKAKPAADDAVTWLANYLLAHNPNTPLITPPSTVTLPPTQPPSSSSLSSSLTPPSPLKTVWVIGGEGETDPLIADLVTNHHFTHIDVPSLLRAAMRNDAQVGERIGEYVETGRPVPWSVGGRVVGGAVRGVGGGEGGVGVAAGGGERWVLSGFPQGLEQALGYEEGVGEVSAVLVSRVRGRGVGVGKGALEGAEDDGVDEVVEHYRAFGKVIEVDRNQAEGKANSHTVQRVLHSIAV